MAHDQRRFDGVTRFFGGVPSRRHLLRGLAAAGLGWGAARLPDGAAAVKNGKGKPKKKGLCARNGSKCRRPGKNCKEKYCLRAPFTIAAKWTLVADHESYLFVPAQNATTGPFPFIDSWCNPDRMPCEEAFPYACVDHDEQQAGDEITTIYTLLRGTYEYWIDLFSTTPEGELTIVLKDSAGRIVRQWASPANSADRQVGWHVFDVDGNDGRVTSIDKLIDAQLIDPRPPNAAHDPNTYVCPEV